MIKLKNLLFKEELSNYSNEDAIKSPAEAAEDLSNLIEKIMPIIEKALEKGGAIMAESLLEDFQKDLKERLKNIRMPQISSNLKNVMSKVKEKEEQFDIEDEDIDKVKSSSVKKKKLNIP